MICKVKFDETREVWYARPYLGRSSDNKPIQPYQEFPEAQTEEEAQAMADEWVDHLTANGLVDSAILTDLLYDYIDMRIAEGCSPYSAKSYRLFTRYVGKYLRGKNARDLTVLELNRFERALMKPKEKGGQGLARNSVRNVHDFLNGAYKYFVTNDICEFNPMMSVVKPRPENHEAQALNIGDFVTLYAQLESMLHQNEPDLKTFRKMMVAFAAWFSLVTGMRVGEVCAVRPIDVFVQPPYIHACGKIVEESGVKPYRVDVLKGRKCRNIDITEDDLKVIELFLEIRRIVCGEIDPTAPIISVDGSCVRPTTISNAFTALAEKLGMPKGFVFHDLRHTHATWILMNGASLRDVADRLGHVDEAITIRLYTHVVEGRGAYAAQVFNEATKRAISGETERMTLGE